MEADVLQVCFFAALSKTKRLFSKVFPSGSFWKAFLVELDPGIVKIDLR